MEEDELLSDLNQIYSEKNVPTQEEDSQNYILQSQSQPLSQSNNSTPSSTSASATSITNSQNKKSPKKRTKKRKRSTYEKQSSTKKSSKTVTKKMKKMSVDETEGLYEEGKGLMNLQTNYFLYATEIDIERLLHQKTPDILKIRDYDDDFCKGLIAKMKSNPSINVVRIVAVVICN